VTYPVPECMNQYGDAGECLVFWIRVKLSEVILVKHCGKVAEFFTRTC